MAAAPRGLLAYLFVVDAVVLVWVVRALTRIDSMSTHAWWVLALLVGIALAFEEHANRAARLRLRFSAELKRDMASVWAVTAAVALPAAGSVILLGSVLLHTWFRQQRRAGQPLYRVWFNGSTEMLGCLAAGAVVRTFTATWSGLPWALAGSVSVLLAIAIYTTINRALVTVALLGVGVRGRGLAGSRDDNLIELATLCLGGLVAVAAAEQPWLCVLVIAPMVTLQRGALMRELEAAATVDSKTGLLNAIAWENLARRELARGARSAGSVAVLILDLDHFKRVNDRFGHLVGDAALRRVGHCLRSTIREFDTVGRFGGEEFVVLLPETSQAEALHVAERLRSAVNELRPATELESPRELADEPMSVSIGVACASTAGAELTELLLAADSALYAAKEGGRNRVVLADRGSGETVTPVTSH